MWEWEVVGREADDQVGEPGQRLERRWCHDPGVPYDLWRFCPESVYDQSRNVQRQAGGLCPWPLPTISRPTRRGFSCWLHGILCLPFHSVRASSWWSRGWPSFPEPPLDHFRALDTKATRSGELGSIKLNTLARFSASDTIRPLLKAHMSWVNKNPALYKEAAILYV